MKKLVWIVIIDKVKRNVVRPSASTYLSECRSIKIGARFLSIDDFLTPKIGVLFVQIVIIHDSII